MNIGLDLDGTLLDSFERHFAVLRDVAPKICASLGPKWTEDLRSAKRNGESTNDFLISKGIDSARAISVSWAQEIEKPKYLKLDELFPGTIDFLKNLGRSNQLYLVTARHVENNFLDHLLELEEFTHCFKKIIVVRPGQNAGVRKSEACSRFALSFVVGDTETDEQWARCSECKFIPVSWGFRSASWWRKRKHRPVDTHRQILQNIF